MMRQSDIRWLERAVVPTLVDVLVELRRISNDSSLTIRVEFLIHDIHDRIKK